jgi:DNA-binding transcriptional ArsR family regulator
LGQITKREHAASKAVSSKRAAVIKALMEGEMYVCDLKDLVGADMSTVSKHLSLMRQAGVLVSDEEAAT